MDIFDLLRRDHRETLDLLDRLSRPPGEADFDLHGRAYLTDRLVANASRHEAAEEMVFWPQVRKRLAVGDELADRGLAQEGDAKALVDLLRFTSAEDAAAERCQELAAVVRDHAAFEETVVWPAMEKVTTRVWRNVIALEYRAARRAGPTRPHPNGPDRPLSLATLGAPAVALDHVRDVFARRRGLAHLDETPEGQADAVEVVTGDHARIERLLAQIERQDDPDDVLVADLVRELSVHDAIERQYLYPLFYGRLDDGDRVHNSALAEHGDIARLAADVRVYPVHDEPRRQLIGQLVTTVRTHMATEEHGPLPALAARLTKEELVELGSRLEAARSKAPTRPHPHTGGTGLGAKLSGLVAAPLDRARDAAAGRRRG